MNFKIYFGICTILLTISFGFSSELNGKPFQRIEIKRVECKGLQDFYYPNMTCYAKPYNRTTYTHTVYVKFKKHLEVYYVKLLFEYRYGNIYREIVKSPKFNWCSIVDNTNPIVKFFYKTLRLSGENLVTKCPINELDSKNVVISTDAFPDIFPRGYYRATVEHLDKNNESFLNITAIVSLRSSDTTTFG
ncbi:CLUMA_CG007068, isoform A [Clunio marinus]|uniref:CLUMA_CG007068, isoform A n=1 Tax=Clunio marinus TaxID=568069 RepID=A0A1J1HZJ8_9DIPT|nr:CLUMA_CG007068, isoform A [Clunio marinus]